MATFKNSKRSAGQKSKPRSRWAGVKAKKDQTPIIAKGEYTAKHKGARIKNDNGEWAVVTFEVVEAKGAGATEPGDEGVMLQGLEDRYNIGLGKVKTYVMALIGCPDEDAYDGFDPEGDFLDAVLGVFPDDEDRTKELESQLAEMVTDREIHFVVRKGKDIVKDGEVVDYYREFTWTVNESEGEDD